MVTVGSDRGPVLRAVLLGLAVAVAHFILTLAGLAITFAAGSSNATRTGMAAYVVVIVTQYLLLGPFVLVNAALHFTTGLPVSAVVACSACWGFAAASIARWRHTRRAQSFRR